MKGRNARLKIMYNGTDISQDISASFKAFTYNDVMNDAADNIDITLKDTDEIWQGDWLPEKGATLDISMIAENWKRDGKEKMDIGKFELDEPEFSGPPEEVKLKGVSIPDNNELRGIERSHQWEKAKLSVVAKDIADNDGFELFYDTDKDDTIDRVEQTEQSDLSFLQKLCSDKGLSLKISDKKIIIFDEEKYEQNPPSMTIYKKSDWVKTYRLRSKTRKIYKACHVKYQDASSGKLIESTFTDKNKKDGKILQVNEQVKTVDEAQKLAKKKLREKNKDELTMSITLVGNFSLVAGNTIKISGWHAFDKYKYIITQSRHNIGSSGYTTAIDIRACLDGY